MSYVNGLKKIISWNFVFFEIFISFPPPFFLYLFKTDEPCKEILRPKRMLKKKIEEEGIIKVSCDCQKVMIM